MRGDLVTIDWINHTDYKETLIRTDEHRDKQFLPWVGLHIEHLNRIAAVHVVIASTKYA